MRELNYPSAEFAAQIRALNLPSRAYNALMVSIIHCYIRPAVVSVAQLEKLTEADLMRGKNLGKVSAQHILTALKKCRRGKSESPEKVTQ